MSPVIASILMLVAFVAIIGVTGHLVYMLLCIAQDVYQEWQKRKRQERIRWYQTGYLSTKRRQRTQR